jgi:hypothetical protein
MKGLASVGWTFFQVDTDFLIDCLENRQIFLGTLPGSTAPGLLGILVASRSRRAKRLDAKLFADVREDALRPMIAGTRRLAYELKLPRVRLVVPKAKKFLALAKEEGFREEDPDFYHGVMERRLRNRRVAASCDARAGRPDGR